MYFYQECSVQVVAEEEQQFLSRQQQFLSQGLPPQQSGAMPPGNQQRCPAPNVLLNSSLYCIKLAIAGVNKTPDRKIVGSPGVAGSPKKVRVQLLSSFKGRHILLP